MSNTPSTPRAPGAFRIKIGEPYPPYDATKVTRIYLQVFQDGTFRPVPKEQPHTHIFDLETPFLAIQLAFAKKEFQEDFSKSHYVNSYTFDQSGGEYCHPGTQKEWLNFLQRTNRHDLFAHCTTGITSAVAPTT